MGLFSRRRSDDRAVDQSPTVEPTPVARREDPPGDDPRRDEPSEVYRASSLTHTPEWAKVPPPSPLLPEMPVVVSTRFDRSLTAWQPPERFLGTLGHTVSPEAPSGLIEGIAVLGSPEEAESAPPADPLPLAAPSVQRSGEGGSSARVISTRRIPTGPGPVAARGGDPLTLAAASPGDETVARGTEAVARAEPATAGLTSSEPLASAVEQLVAMEPLSSEPSRLVHAPTPPDLPLANLPSTSWPGEPGTGPVSSASAPGSGDPGPTQAVDLVSERPIVQTRSEAIASTASTSPALTTPSLAGSHQVTDLPLAPRTVTDPQGGEPDPMPWLDAAALPEGGYLDSAAAPASAPGTGVAETGTAGTGPAETGQDETGGPAKTAETGQPQTVAPLVGLATPIAAEATQVDAPGPAASIGAPTGAGPDQPMPVQRAVTARSGLGEPMRGLPPTATSWDISAMTMDQQIRASRALIQSQMRSGARGAFPGLTLTPAAASTAPAAPPVQRRIQPPEQVFAGMPLRQAPLEQFAATPAGVVPTDLPDDTGEYAPLLSMDLPQGAEPAGAAAPGAGPVAISRRIDADPGSPDLAHLAAQPVRLDFGGAAPTRVMPSGPGPVVVARRSDSDGMSRGSAGVGLAGVGLASASLTATELALPAGAAGRAPLPPPGDDALGFAPSLPAEQPVRTLPLASPSVASLDPDVLVETVLQRVSGFTTAAPLGLEREVFAATSGQSPAAPAQDLTVPNLAVQRADTQPQQWTSETLPASDKGPMERPSDSDLSNLSRWLYPLIKHRLKGDLREDRERAGLLTDHYRKW